MSTPTAPSPLHAVTERVEHLEALDELGRKVAKAVRDALGPGALKDALSGTWLGHALHPLLTDVVIGSWTSATILDLVGGERAAPGAQKLVGVGIAAYGPTALTGATDWADSEPADPAIRRVGLVHAATNSTALALYTLSYRARRNGRRGRAIALGLAGAGALTAGGHLGAHLSLQQGVGVNQTTFDRGPSEWTPLPAEAASIGEGELRHVVADETPVLLVRQGGRLRALHDRCSHRGCSLADGELQGDTVVCACHGSTFALDDGTVQRGPATTDQPAFDVREAGGRLEVRLREP